MKTKIQELFEGKKMRSLKHNSDLEIEKENMKISNGIGFIRFKRDDRLCEIVSINSHEIMLMELKTGTLDTIPLVSLFVKKEDTNNDYLDKKMGVIALALLCASALYKRNND